MGNDDNLMNQTSCWRKHGVWGVELPRCEKLKYVNHCRNCDVFEKAAVDAFSSARKKIEQSEISGVDIEQQSCLPFRLSTYCFSVPTNSVLSISDQVSLHSIPFNKNKAVKGLVAINHEVYPLLNMSDLLMLKPEKNTINARELHKLYKRILTVNVDGQHAAFYVDDIYRIHHYLENEISSGNGEFSHSFLTSGYLNKIDEWCDDCHLLNLTELYR